MNDTTPKPEPRCARREGILWDRNCDCQTCAMYRGQAQAAEASMARED